MPVDAGFCEAEAVAAVTSENLHVPRVFHT